MCKNCESAYEGGIDGLIEKGKYFGYPNCCIAEFVKVVSKFIDGKAAHVPHPKKSMLGYRPCKKCAKKTKRSLIKTINNNRKHPIAFELMIGNS